MNIFDATKNMLDVYKKGQFNIDNWKTYIDSNMHQIKDLCLDDVDECIKAGLSWDDDYLPVLNAVYQNIDKCDEIRNTFYKITNNLNDVIYKKFNKTLDVDIILYLGLCNGAGWVTKVNGRTTVLLGIEKILELNWGGIDAMNGLILHELGHAYQDQYGILHREFDSLKDHFLWQLFTEGIAMVFEQQLVDDKNYYHQDTNGWKDWCSKNIKLIRESFNNDLDAMAENNQRYFGDWVKFEGYGDTGYYLGTQFIRYILEYDSFDNLILYDINNVKIAFKRFLNLD